MNELANNSGVLVDIRKIIEQGRRQAYTAAGQAAIVTYWQIGRRIVEEEQNGEKRAQYGKKLIAMLSQQQTCEYGSGYSKRSLEEYRRFLFVFKKLRDCARMRAQSDLDSFSYYHA